MTLYVWTENKQVCSHFHVFADDEEIARQLVVEHIRSSWFEEDNDEPLDYRERRAAEEIERFLDPTYWYLRSVAVKENLVL